jgi:hypothetical protein
MEWRNVGHGYLDVRLGGDDPTWPTKGIQEVPYYSSSIAAAMQVVEKMREGGFGVRIEDSRTVNASRRTEYDRVLQDGEWQVGFLEPEREDYNAVIDGKVCHGARQIFSVTAATLPEAICRAALAVMGSTVSHASLRGGVTFGW